MPSLWQRMKGNLFLGYRALWAHPLRKLGRGRDLSGQARFLASYAPEGNVVTSNEDRVALAQASRCIHCGLCDAYDLIRAEGSWPRTVYAGPSALPVAYSRATPDLPFNRALLERIDPARLASAEAVCPTRVPLGALAGYLRRKLAQVQTAQQPAAHP